MGLRSRRTHGTFQLVLYRSDFVVLASDTAAVEDMKSSVENRSKLICHDTLPLAIAIGGMSEFTVEASGTTTNVEQLLREEFPKWGMRGSMSLLALYEWAQTTLLPLVQEVYEPDVPDPQNVSFLIGMWKGSQAVSDQIIIAHDGVSFGKSARNSSYVLSTVSVR